MYPDGVYECITALLYLNISIKKIGRVISVTLGKLTKKDIEKLRSAGVKSMKEVLVT